jgi:hypothetical protein
LATLQTALLIVANFQFSASQPRKSLEILEDLLNNLNSLCNVAPLQLLKKFPGVLEHFVINLNSLFNTVAVRFLATRLRNPLEIIEGLVADPNPKILFSYFSIPDDSVEGIFGIFGRLYKEHDSLIYFSQISIPSGLGCQKR